jgi:thiol-disulfide isomerase/thioredoxin
MAGVRACVIVVALCMATLSIGSFARSGILQVAPDFARNDLRGNALRLHRYRGKLVLLSFWATWCEPCLAEIPVFATWQNTYRAAGLQIIGVAMDDDSAPVKRAYEKFHLNYPVVMGDTQLGELFGGVLGLPLNYLIDPNGRVVGRYQGEVDLRKLELQINSLLPRRAHATCPPKPLPSA